MWTGLGKGEMGGARGAGEGREGSETGGAWVRGWGGGGKSEGREMGGVWVWTGLRKEEGGEREMLRGRRCASGVILRG